MSRFHPYFSLWSVYIDLKMSIMATLIFLILALFDSDCSNCHSTIAIKGVVLEKGTEAPINGVNIYIAGSQKGTTSDADGAFFIADIEQESFQLVFSHIGYEVRTINFNANTSSKTLRIILNPLDTELEGVEVSGKKDRKWSRDLKKFKRFFLGEAYSDEQATLNNAYLLDFARQRDKGFFVTNKPGLEISNHHLGYDLYFQLLKFELGDVKTYLGYSRFSEMETEDQSQQQTWKDNRLKAYQGSVRHFLKSLIDQTLDQEGYSAVLKPSDLGVPLDMDALQKAEPLRMADEGIYKKNISVNKVSDKVYEVSFKGLIEVVYFNEEDQYGDPQSSEISINQTLRLQKNGVLLNPGALVVNGYWIQEGMLESLPFEYEPGQ